MNKVLAIITLVWNFIAIPYTISASNGLAGFFYALGYITLTSYLAILVIKEN